jgi:fatty acid desaturase
VGTGDKQREFDQIVDRLVADFPSLAGRRRWPRAVLVTAAIVGGVVWGLLSIAMVAWGTAGVVLTLVVAGLAITGLAADSYRWRRRGRV